MTQGLGPGACVRSCRRMSPKFQLPERCLRVLMHLPHPSHRHLVRLSALGLTHYIIYIYIYIYDELSLRLLYVRGALALALN